MQRCTAEKAPEPEPNSSDLDNSPDSEDMLGYLGRSIFSYTSKMKDLAIDIDLEIHADIESATRVMVTVQKVCVLSTPTLG